MGRRRNRPLENALAQALAVGISEGEQRAFERVLRASASDVLGLEVADTLDFVRQAGVKGALPLITEAARDVWPERYRTVLSGPLTALMVASTESKAPVLGSFDLANPKTGEYFSRYVDKLGRDLSDTSRANAMKVIQEALDEGLSMPDASARLRERLGGLNKSRSDLIANNEVLRASKGASYMQAIESDLVASKTRRSAGDSKVRPEHAAINGETVPVDEPYSNGEMYSGDSSVRCRCVDLYNISPELLREKTA